MHGQHASATFHFGQRLGLTKRRYPKDCGTVALYWVTLVTPIKALLLYQWDPLQGFGLRASSSHARKGWSTLRETPKKQFQLCGVLGKMRSQSVILLLFALQFHNNDASTVTICVVGTTLGPKYIVDTYPALTPKPYTLQRHTDHMGKLKLSNPSCSYLKPRGSIYTIIRELGPKIQYYSRN